MSDLAVSGAGGADPYAAALADMKTQQANSLRSQAEMTKMNADFTAQSDIIAMQSAMKDKMHNMIAQQIRSLSQ
ncbi:MAG: hypothetical protein WAQ53_09845 [Thiofilum sp.]|uniref:hypothetical protein n=1 Tax=Thiofilum sp. TaxID=2212733 RepID=UPI0025DDEC81|nr:hypothetical protein [Thiofilum sp.]MBK8453162.1 hypothetical protein [Thiofilum sp.]